MANRDPEPEDYPHQQFSADYIAKRAIGESTTPTGETVSEEPVFVPAEAGYISEEVNTSTDTPSTDSYEDENDGSNG